MRWIVGLALFALTHVGASFLVPLQVKDQHALGGLLRWAWPWGVGDHGPIGTIGATGGAPFSAFVLAMASATLLLLAGLAVFGVWVPVTWWRSLVIAGATCGLVLVVLFFGPTKVLPILGYVGVLWAATLGWHEVGIG